MMLNLNTRAKSLLLRRVEEIGRRGYRRANMSILDHHITTAWLILGFLLYLSPSEFFEYGQGYVAIMRVRRLDQLHFWCLNRGAFTVHPGIKDQ